MEFRKEISDRVCEKLNCQFLKQRSNGDKYCQAYFPDCDEYEDYEQILNIRPKYFALRDELAQLTSKLRQKGITTPSTEIKYACREDRWD